MIDTRQLLLIAVGSCVASVVPRGLKEVVISYVELRLSVACGDFQDK